MAQEIARKAIIIGGGPAGLAAALRLKQKSGISSTVYELRDEPTTLGGAIGIFPNGLRLLDRMGVHDRLLARGNSHSTLTIRSLQSGTVGEQDLVGLSREKTGFGYLRIKRTDLVDVLLEATREAGIPVHYGKRLTRIDETANNVTATFSDGSTDTADLLLGCDGIHSHVRKLHVDPSQKPIYSDFSSIAALIPSSILTEDQAAQVQGLNATFTQEGMFMVMNCKASGEEIMWGFSREVPLPQSGDSRDGWEVHRKEEVQKFKDHLLDLLHGFKGEWVHTLEKIVGSTSAVKFYPIYRLPLGGSWHRGRCLLLGDAAHAMPPHAGQGVSMAMEDVFLLSKLLADKSRPLTQVYDKYDAIRRPRVDEIAHQAMKNGNVRRNTGPWGLKIKEALIWGYMWASSVFKLENYGAGLKQLTYDVDEEEI